MTKKTNLTIHQTLHGYKDGHALLASSTDLSIEDKKEMAKLSDYSGSGAYKSFYEYYTGYSLERFYAFSKTWYANEMPRPGSVWTHTLLLEQSTLWLIRDIQLLCKLFRRPGREKYEYNEALEVNMEDYSTSNIIADEYFYIIASKLYNSSKPLIILSNGSQEYEQQVFKLWLEQWPRMRRNFSFCTGSLSPRLLSGKYLDLQVMPYGRESGLSNTDYQSIEVFNPKSDEYPISWKNSYQKEDLEAVRKYMTDVGADISSKMTNFSLLLGLFQNAKQENTDYYTDFILNNKLEPGEGLAIKNFVVSVLWNRPNSSKVAVLRYLLQPENRPYWDTKKLIISPSFVTTVDSSDIKLVLNLVKSTFTTTDFVDILKALPVKLWLFDYSIYNELFDQLFPTIQNSLWKENLLLELDSDVRHKWIETALKSEEVRRKDLIYFLLQLPSDDYSLKSYEVFGPLVVGDILSWMEKFDNPIPHGWKYILRENLVTAFIDITGLKLNKVILALIFEIWSPTDRHWSKIPESTFLRFLSAVSDTNLKPDTTAIYTYFLTSCMYDVFSYNKSIVEIIFQPLHDDLERSIYEHTTWQRFHLMMAGALYDLVESDFFSKHYWDKSKIPDWDRCELLRRSLITCFFANDWPAIFLIQVIKNRSTFQYLVEFCHDIKPLKKWLKPVISQLQDAGLQISFYYDVLRKIY